jgi:hypothetical protein
LQNWLLNKGDNAYLPKIIETPIMTPDNDVFLFLPKLAKSKGSTKRGYFGLTFCYFLQKQNACGIWGKYFRNNIKLT